MKYMAGNKDHSKGKEEAGQIEPHIISHVGNGFYAIHTDQGNNRSGEHYAKGTDEFSCKTSCCIK